LKQGGASALLFRRDTVTPLAAAACRATAIEQDLHGTSLQKGARSNRKFAFPLAGARKRRNGFNTFIAFIDRKDFIDRRPL